MLAEVRSTCSSGCYRSVLHAYGLFIAVDATINLVYPMFNEGIRPSLNDAIVPIHRSRGEESDVTISIMWSTTRPISHNWFEPNHFVPLLPQSTPLKFGHSVSSERSPLQSKVLLYAFAVVRIAVC